MVVYESDRRYFQQCVDNKGKILEAKGPILRDIISRLSNLCQALLDKVFIGRRGKVVSPVCFQIIIEGGLCKTRNKEKAIQ